MWCTNIKVQSRWLFLTNALNAVWHPILIANLHDKVKVGYVMPKECKKAQLSHPSSIHFTFTLSLSYLKQVKLYMQIILPSKPTFIARPDSKSAASSVPRYRTLSWTTQNTDCINFMFHVTRHVRVGTQLGAKLECTLWFQANVNILLESAHASFQTLYLLITRWSKIKNKHKITIFNTIIRSVMSYEAPVWSAEGKNYNCINKISSTVAILKNPIDESPRR